MLDGSVLSRLDNRLVMVCGALLGALMGAAFLFGVGFGAVAMGAAAVAAGFAAARLQPSIVLVIVTTVAALASSTGINTVANPSVESAILGLFQGVIFMICFLIPVLMAVAERQRRTYVERGWELALAQAREQDVRVEQAVRRERDTMASEIHDGLGHRLTLIAVQVARLSLDDSLPESARTELRSIRANAAEAADELGETVGLLSDNPSDITASLRGLDVADVLERARSSGIDVRADVHEGIEQVIGDHAKAAVLRTLQEGLTNAAKHVPGSTVNVAIGLDGALGELTLRIRNPVGSSESAGNGHGIVALRHRAELLGGELDVERSADFTLTMRLPVSAVPSAAAGRDMPPRAATVTEEAAASGRKRRRARGRVWLIPAVLVAAVVVSVCGYFIYTNAVAVLPPERFATIDVGDSRAQTEESLPPVQMLDAPRKSLTEPSDASCSYYEASVSFFERVEVYRVCFADEEVVSVDTIPAS